MNRLLSIAIRTQILLIAFIVAIPAVGIIIYSGMHMREEAMNKARIETLRLADAIEAQQQNLITGAQQAIIALTQLPEVKRQNARKVRQILNDILELNTQFSNIFIADRNGFVWATAVPQLLHQNVSDRRYFKNALANGQMSSGEYVVSRATTRPAFNVAAPLKDERGATIGIISVGFKLNAYKQVLQRAKLPPDTSFVLLDYKGTVLYRAINPEEYIGRQFDAALFKDMQEGPDVATLDIRTTISGDERVMTYRKLFLPGQQVPYMYIRAGIPVSTVLADANKALVRNMVVFSSFLVLAIYFAWLIGKRSIADRVALLENASRNLAKGDLHIRVSDLVAGGELGRLGQTFDSMAHQLSVREQALIESERNYREIFDSTKDGIFVHDAESGMIIEINKTVEELYAYSREEILNKTAGDLSAGDPPYSQQDAIRWIQKTLREGPQTFEWLARKKNGQLFWTEVVLSATSIGGRGRVLAVIRDISARRQAEETLRERDALLRQAVNVSQIGIFDHDQRTDTIYWSPQQRVIHGWGPDEPINLQAFVDRIHPEDRESIAASIERAHDPMGDGIWDVEHRIIRRDGTVRWLKERSQTFFEGEGNARRPVRTIGAVLDITERKRVEQALVQEKAFSDMIIDSLPGVFYICDEQGRLVRWNDNEKTVTGYSWKELSQMSVLSLFQNDRELMVAHLREVFETGRALVEASIVTKSGMTIPFYLTGFRMVVDDKRYLIGLGIDVSERKRLEQQLHHAQKMESIGQLAGGIAHDFNNILAAIVGYGNIMQMKMRTDDPLRVYTNQVLASAERAANLTQSLLAFSRKQVINPKNIDLNELVRKVEKFLSRIIGEDIVLSTSLSEESLLVFADPTQIEQVLMNLATNARDSMPKGGRLMIETERVMLDDEYIETHGFGLRGCYAVLTVNDTGEGMDDKTKQKIFEPFFTTKEVGRGTGLGLSIVYGIVKQNKGYINVYSEVGKGTTFKIYLPFVSARAGEDRHPEVQLLLRGGTETMLLAEDNETVRLLNRDLLQEFGYTVIEAADGEEALQKLREHRDQISLLILDVIMPKKSGREVFEEARRSNPNIKVIFTSGYPADLIQKEGFIEQGLNLLSKPASPQEMLKRVRYVLDQ